MQQVVFLLLIGLVLIQADSLPEIEAYCIRECGSLEYDELVKELDHQDELLNNLVTRAVNVEHSLDQSKKEHDDADRESRNLLLRLDRLHSDKEHDICPKKHRRCLKGAARDGRPCVANILVCDGEPDCLDESDEDPELCKDFENKMVKGRDEMAEEPEEHHEESHEHCHMDCGHGGHHAHWGYDDATGPVCWGHCFDICSSGHKQSPIDLTSDALDHKMETDVIHFEGYDVPREATLKNNGHTVVLGLEDKVYSITGLGLPGKYIAAQLHFHWGSDDHRGSEHTMGGLAFPMEMHIVHYSDKYAGISEAVSHEDGLAVLGFMFSVTGKENREFSHIESNLKDVTNPGTSADVHHFVLSDLIPSEDHLHTAFRYSGSLTTPGCAESVVWTVFDTPIQISDEQMVLMRTSVHEEDHETILTNNFRPPQPIHERTVNYINAHAQ